MQMEFDNVEVVETFYKMYSKCVGFSVHKNDKKKHKNKLVEF